MRYRRVSIGIWDDERFLRFEPARQVVWFHLLTGHPTTNVPGLLRGGPATIAESMHWPLERFQPEFDAILELGMARYDPQSRLVWLPKALRHNEPDNPNVVKSWGGTWDTFPDCPLLADVYGVLRAHCEARGPGFLRAFEKVIRRPNAEPSEPYAKPFREPYREPFPEPSRNGIGNVSQLPKSPLGRVPETGSDPDPGSGSDPGSDPGESEKQRSKRPSWQQEALAEFHTTRLNRLVARGLLPTPDVELHPGFVNKTISKMVDRMGGERSKLWPLFDAYFELDWPAKKDPPYTFQVLASETVWLKLLEQLGDAA